MVEPDRTQVKIQYVAETMPDAWRITKARIEILTLNILLLVFFYGNNGYANAY